MLMGWITGAYLSLSALGLKPLVEAFLSEKADGRFAVAHSLQLPIVAIGVGTWAIQKALGRF